jgi:hypothetical protein
MFSRIKITSYRVLIFYLNQATSWEFKTSGFFFQGGPSPTGSFVCFAFLYTTAQNDGEEEGARACVKTRVLPFWEPAA